MKKLYISILLMFGIFCLISVPSIRAEGLLKVKPISIGPVKVEGRQLKVDFDHEGQYTPFKIKGVSYQPSPVGTFPSQWGYCEYCDPVTGCLYPDPMIDPDTGLPTGQFKPISCKGPDSGSVYDRLDVDLDRDFNNLVDMNINTIRTWGVVTDILMNKAQDYGLKVCAGFWVDYSADINPGSPTNVRATIKQQFRDYVTKFKDKPALLMWVIGNENNLWNNPNNKANWYSLVNELAQEAYNIEGLYYHPVATANGEIADIGISGYGTTDSQMYYLDIWGVNVYRGHSFGSLFTDFANKSQKPLWISEYGIDAWHSNNMINPQDGYEDESTQAQWVGDLLDELSGQAICIGSTLMEYSDEWWKADEWTVAVRTQDAGGNYIPGAAPDNFLNEEYFGIMRIQDNGLAADMMTRRSVYYVLQDKFAGYIPVAGGWCAWTTCFKGKQHRQCACPVGTCEGPDTRICTSPDPAPIIR